MLIISILPNTFATDNSPALKPDDFILKCRYLTQKGKYAEAGKLLSKQIKIEPENWQARMLFFTVLEETGNRREMRLQERFFSNYSRSGKLKTAAAYTAAGKALSARNPKLALDLFRKAIALDKNYERALNYVNTYYLLRDIIYADQSVLIGMISTDVLRAEYLSSIGLLVEKLRILSNECACNDKDE